jgi:hypothetical protein
MEKNLSAPVVKLMMGKMPPYTLKKDYGNDLLLEDDLEAQNVMMELGELDDLTQIYGEMGEIL